MLKNEFLEGAHELLSKYPDLSNVIKPFIGASEFIRGNKRYCLWLDIPDYHKYTQYEEIKIRLNKVSEFRSKSRAAGTVAYAKTPHLFVQRTYQEKPFIFVPQVSSERREYIPIGWMNKGIVTSDKAFSVYDAPIWLFGLISSKFHIAWIRSIGGRLKTDISYSSNLCYNNFPFPDINQVKKEEIATLAEEVLMVREHHTEKTLAEMYDPDKMPQDLRDAHTALDLAVDSCYRKQPFNSDEERLEVLFKLYERMNKK